ncbi:hypothetical protein ACFQV8_08410 [Pseudonocardia benzenivorans]
MASPSASAIATRIRSACVVADPARSHGVPPSAVRSHTSPSRSTKPVCCGAAPGQVIVWSRASAGVGPTRLSPPCAVKVTGTEPVTSPTTDSWALGSAVRRWVRTSSSWVAS